MFKSDVADVEKIRGFSPKVWRRITPFLLIGVFLVELATPRGFNHGILYAVPILTAAFSLNKRLIAAAVTAGAALTPIGYFLSPGDLDPSHAAGNRATAIMLLLITGFLATMAVRHLQGRMDAKSEATSSALELGRTQRLLQVAGRVARIGGWSVDARTRDLEWSEEVAVIHELSPGEYPTIEEAVGYYAPESRQKLIDVLEACLRDGVAYDEEFEFLTPSGQRKWVRSIGEPVRDGEGNIIKANGALQDVTERRLLEESLEQSHSRFRQLADSMPLIVWTADPDGTVDYANKALFEYTTDRAMNLSADEWTSSIHPEDVETLRSAWTEAVRLKRDYSIEFRIRRGRDGSYRWHKVSALPVRDDEGAVVKWFGTATDIHDEKQKEEELARLSGRLVSTLESITDGFYILDHEWRFTYINSEFADWLRQPKEEVLGRTLWEHSPHLVGTTIESEFKRAVSAQTPVEFVQHFPRVQRWVRVHAYPGDEGLSAFLEDITAQRELEEKQRQSQRLEAIGQLTGGIAHDFNNLLTVILGNAEALTEELSDNEALRPAAELTMKAAERGAELTSRLLSFARQQPLDPKSTDINELVSSLDSLLRRTLGEDIDIRLVRKGELWRAAVDTSQFENALLNLCINARDAMPEGGRLTIETGNVHLDEEYAHNQVEVVPGPYVMIAVSDTGTGMTPEIVEKAFEPFFTTKAVGQGSGLGLSMVYGFIKQSRGHLKIYSEVGHGTTVKIYLPRAESEDNGADKTRASVVLPTGNERILLVEDDDIVREHVAGQLRGLGYKVTMASNGVKALEILDSGAEFDLLFTDVVMPGGIGGRQLSEQARQARPHLRVLFTSGYTENSIVHNGRLDPGVNLLNKPYRRQDLANKLRSVLDRPLLDQGSPEPGTSS